MFVSLLHAPELEKLNVPQDRGFNRYKRGSPQTSEESNSKCSQEQPISFKSVFGQFPKFFTIPKPNYQWPLIVPAFNEFSKTYSLFATKFGKLFGRLVYLSMYFNRAAYLLLSKLIVISTGSSKHHHL